MFVVLLNTKEANIIGNTMISGFYQHILLYSNYGKIPCLKRIFHCAMPMKIYKFGKLSVNDGIQVFILVFMLIICWSVNLALVTDYSWQLRCY